MKYSISFYITVYYPIVYFKLLYYILTIYTIYVNFLQVFQIDLVTNPPFILHSYYNHIQLNISSVDLKTDISGNHYKKTHLLYLSIIEQTSNYIDKKVVYILLVHYSNWPIPSLNMKVIYTIIKYEGDLYHH